MNRRQRRAQARLNAPSARTDALVAAPDRAKGIQVARADDWASVATGLGTASRDKRLSYAVQPSYRWNRQELLELYKGDPVVARIIDDRAKEMLRKWFSLSLDGDDDGSEACAIMDQISGVDGLHLRTQLLDWLRWARLYGGCALYLGVTDGLTPDQPIDMENIQSFDFLNVIDRYSCYPYSYYSSRLQANFGQVYQYQVNDGIAFGQQAPNQKRDPSSLRLVHASRIIRCDGVRLAPEDMLFNNGWGDSVLTRVRQVCRDDALLWDSMSLLMQEYSTAVVKMKGIAEALSSPEGKALVQARMEGVQLARSMARLTLLDGGDESGQSGEEWSRDTISLAGVSDVMDKFMLRVSMAADMPATRLWGLSPGGLGSNGEGEQDNYHESIEGDQQTVLLPGLHKLIQVMLRAKNGPTSGQEPPKWAVKFNPLKSLNALEQATLEKTVAEKDQIYITQQVLDPREVAQSRYGGPEYSTQTKLDASVRGQLEDAVDASLEAQINPPAPVKDQNAAPTDANAPAADGKQPPQAA